MTAGGFDRANARVLVHEGHYSNNPHDPGGVTLQGIIQRVDDGWRHRHGLAPRPLTPQLEHTPEWPKERDAIYRSMYWDMIRGDELPAGVDYVVYDGAVNSGFSQSVKWLQRALNACAAPGSPQIPVDGSVGQTTLEALDNNQDNDKLVADICGRRLAFLQHLNTWGYFGKGWGSRVVEVKHAGQLWATGSVGERPATFADLGNAKGTISDLPKTATAEAASAGGVGGGTIAGSATELVNQLTGQLQGFADTLVYIRYAVILLVVVGGALGLYALYRRRKNAQVREADVFTDVPDPEIQEV